LKNARMVESVRGAKGGYRLRRPPEQISLAEVIRLIDGAIAPFGDAEQLRNLIETDDNHRALYQVFLDVRDAAARILENTTFRDLVTDKQPTQRRGRLTKSKKPKILPILVHDNSKPAGPKS